MPSYCFLFYNNNEITNYFIFRTRRATNDYDARVTLIGLFPLHQGTNCDKIVSVKNYNGFQRMEALVLAINELNKYVNKMRHSSRSSSKERKIERKYQLTKSNRLTEKV